MVIYCQLFNSNVNSLKKALLSFSFHKTLRTISALVTLAIIIFVFVTLTNTTIYAQLQNTIGLKITSHEQGQEVPVGQLTISGTSTDNATSDCIVYADWNNLKPFQKAVATGAGGVNDYSTWNFTYTQNYHLIANGTNELTSKLSCVSSPANLTKWNSVIVVGVMNTNQQQQQRQEQSIPTSVVNNTTTSDNSNALENGTAPSTENNAAAPFVFPLPSENPPPSTSEETGDIIDGE
jgi:hypothetical protein